MAEGTRMQQRRANQAVWDTSNYILADGEIGVATDINIIKVGNGIDTWGNLPPAFSSQYLPVLGKSADSELLDGINSSGFVQIADPKVTADNDSIAKRTSAGRLIAVSATVDAELTTLGQQTTAIAAAIDVAKIDSRKDLIARTSNGSTALQVGDVGSILRLNSASAITLTLPLDSSAAIPVGSWVDVHNINVGLVTLVAEGGVTFDKGVYPSLVMRNHDVLRLLKSAANTWMVLTGQMDSGYILAPTPSGITVRNSTNHYSMRNRIVHVVFDYNGSFTTLQILYTLPVGFRPSYPIYSPQSLDNAGQIPFSIKTNGNVVFSSTAGTAGVLGHLTFHATQ